MEGITQNYIENPTLVIALSIGIGVLAVTMWWLIKWVLNKLITTVENNTSALNKVANSIERFDQTMTSTNKVLGDLTVEQKYLNQQLQQVVKK